MATAVLIIGESGSGKSTSVSSLNPKETFLLNVLGKPLPFKGWKENYAEVRGDTGNYFSTDDSMRVLKIIEYANNRHDIKNFVLDDWQYTLANTYMRRALEKGYDKFSEIGQNGWNVLRALVNMRSDMNVFVLAHNEVGADGKSKIKTIGKILDDKITVEGMFTIVLHTMILEGKYCFLTQNDGSHLAKSPIDMFPRFIPNDLAFVSRKIKEYEGSSVQALQATEARELEYSL